MEGKKETAREKSIARTQGESEFWYKKRKGSGIVWHQWFL